MCVCGGRGGTRGNFGTGVGVSILKPTPIIYPAFEKKKNSLFIYLISFHILFFEFIWGGWGLGNFGKGVGVSILELTEII